MHLYWEKWTIDLCGYLWTRFRWRTRPYMASFAESYPFDTCLNFLFFASKAPTFLADQKSDRSSGSSSSDSSAMTVEANKHSQAMVRKTRSQKKRNPRPTDPSFTWIASNPQQNHATTAAVRRDLPSERRCPLSSLHASFTDPSSDVGATKPKVVYEKSSMPDQSMFLIVRQFERKMDLDFVMAENVTPAREDPMFDATVKVRIKLPDDRYTISFCVYQPRLTMEVVRWPKGDDENVRRLNSAIEDVVRLVCSHSQLMHSFDILGTDFGLIITQGTLFGMECRRRISY